MIIAQVFRRALAVAILCATAAPTVLAQQPDEEIDPFQYPNWVKRKSFLRAWNNLKQRAYPAGDIPADARANALQQIAQADALSAPVQGNRWVSVGPAPIRAGQTAPPMPVSGRVSEIAVDPRDTTH